jgi:hypothetical protein
LGLRVQLLLRPQSPNDARGKIGSGCLAAEIWGSDGVFPQDLIDRSPETVGQTLLMDMFEHHQPHGAQ